jgi:hypothetical protein
MINTAEYTEKLGQVTRGEITTETWMAYCRELLSQILDLPEVREVMVRLKHR